MRLSFKSVHKYLLFLSLLLSINSCASRAPADEIKQIGNSKDFPVYAVGSMDASQKNSAGRLDLHKFPFKKHLYAVGVGENLIGEIIVIDGNTHYIISSSNKDITVKSNLPEKATFLVFTYVKNWEKIPVPKEVDTLKSLERFIDNKTKSYQKRNEVIIPFLLKGNFSFCKVHVAHTSASSYFTIPNNKLTLLGFFTKQYAGHYTYKDNLTHIHTVSDKTGGHVDDFSLKMDTNKYIYLPKITTTQ